MTPGPHRIPPAAFVPEPPDGIDPLPFRWPAGTQIVLVDNSDSPAAASSFHAGTADRPGRFHPFKPVGKRKALPVIYGAERIDGAISETVFHDVPVRGTRIVDATRFQHHLALTLAPARDLNLADLSGLGLGRIGVSRGELIDSDPRSYRQTVLWARAIHHHPALFDGLMWVSRQFDRSRAVMLFGDRVTRAELPQDSFSIPTSLRIGTGLDAVLAVAGDRDISVTAWSNNGRRNAAICIARLGQQPGADRPNARPAATQISIRHRAVRVDLNAGRSERQDRRADRDPAARIGRQVNRRSSTIFTALAAAHDCRTRMPAGSFWPSGHLVALAAVCRSAS